MSKEVHTLGAQGITMASVLDRANTVGIIIVSSWILVILAHVTGNLHPLAGAMAIVSAFLSVCLMAYKNFMRRQQKSEVVMMGFGLYVTAPLFVCSAVAYYLSSGWIARV